MTIPGAFSVFERSAENRRRPSRFHEPGVIEISGTRTWEELAESRQGLARRLNSLPHTDPQRDWSNPKTWEELAESRRSLARRLDLLTTSQPHRHPSDTQIGEESPGVRSSPAPPPPASTTVRANVKSLLKRGASAFGGFIPESGSRKRLREREERRARLLIRSMAVWNGED